MPRLSSRLFAVAAAVAAALAPCAASARDSCPQFFAGGQRPALLNPKLAQDTVPLCYAGFGSLYSGLALDPLYSADLLTSGHVREERGIGRHGSFHEESALPAAMRVSPSDYRNRRGTYYDRGHMVPNSDMWTPELQEQTFTMANVVPQSADNNEVLHEGVEAAVRDLAVQDGKLYVVTGPVFRGATVRRMNGKSFIPTQIFKAVYDPARGGAAAYVENNQPGQDYAVVSVSELSRITGIDVFPSLPASVKDLAMSLPEPAPGTRNRSSRESRAMGLSYHAPRQVSYETLTVELSAGEKAADSGRPAHTGWMLLRGFRRLAAAAERDVK